MENSPSIPESALSPSEFEQLKSALSAKYPSAKGLLGSNLGAFIRANLADPDLKGRFHGLRAFLAKYFPNEVVWRDRRGLDDIYDTYFDPSISRPPSDTWKPVSREPSASFWAGFTNPNIYGIQFAWSSEKQAVLQSPLGVAVTPELVQLKKLSTEDYALISSEFSDSLEKIDPSIRPQASECAKSADRFTALMRERGFLPSWEEFRIDRVCHAFSDRLKSAGAEPQQAIEWEHILRLSQQRARLERSPRAPSLIPTRKPLQVPAGFLNSGMHLPEPRDIAAKAVEFLSDPEVAELRLPLGTVMRALVSLVANPK